MSKILIFFAVVMIGFFGWFNINEQDRKEIKHIAKKFVFPMIVAGVITLVLVWFSFNSNGRII